MSNSINNSSFYLFLAKQTNWVEDADKNDDGIVSKNEFTAYFNSEFDWSTYDPNGKPSNANDIIGKFFASLDTESSGADEARLTTAQGTKVSNKNALGSKEIDAANKQLEKYIALANTLEAAKAKCPVTGEGHKEWKAIIEQLITDAFNANPFNEQLGDTEINEYVKQANIQYYQTASPNEILNEYPRFKGYNLLTDDSDFPGKLKTFVTENCANWNADNVKTNIENYIRAYLNGDTSTYEGGGVFLNKDLFTHAVMNGLQGAHTSTTLSNGTTVTSTEYPDAFKNIFTTYINEVLATTTSHSETEITAAINGFSFEGRLTALEEAVAVEDAKKAEEEQKKRDQDTIKGLVEALIPQLLSKLQNELALPQTVANAFFATITTDTVIDALGDKIQLNDTKDALTAESQTAIENHIKETVLKNLETKLYSSDYTSKNLKELNDDHDERTTLIDKLNRESADDDKTVLQAYKDAAIDYCAWVAKSGNADYKKCLQDVFTTSDYNNEIKNLETVEAIQAKITELSNKLESIINPADIKVGYVNTSFSVQSGEAVSKKVIDDVEDVNNNAITTGMTYNASCPDFKVSIVNGELKFTAPTVTEDTSYEITIEPMYNGVSIGKTQKITITVKKPIDRDGVDWSKLKDNTDISRKCDYYVGSVKGKNKDNNNTLTFEYMYNNSINVAIVTNEKCTGQSSPTAVFTKANTQISNIANNLATIAKNNGCDETAANKAANKLKELYKAAFNQYTFLGSKGDSGEKTVTYEGKTYSYYCGRADYEDNVYGSYEADKGASASGLSGSLGLQVNMRAVGDNHYEIVLNMKRFMDLFNEFYKQALGS